VEIKKQPVGANYGLLNKNQNTVTEQMQDNDFRAKAANFDALAIAYKPQSENGVTDLESYWNRHTQPTLTEIHAAFCELIDRKDFKREWFVSCDIMTEDGYQSWSDKLRYYPDGENAFIRLAIFIERQSLRKANIEELCKTHETPSRRTVQTALAALYVRLNEAALRNERLAKQPKPSPSDKKPRQSHNAKYTYLYSRISELASNGVKQADAIRNVMRENGMDSLDNDLFEKVRKAFGSHKKNPRKT
jgi:hypothetical protein